MNLNYKTYGQGFPVVILHGLFGTLDNWQGIAKILAENYLIFTVDQRNHGRSPHHPEMSYKIMAEDLREFMEQHWIHEAIVIGHSMGGKTAMQFALDFPDMVEKLVVVDIGPFANSAGHEQIFEALFSVDLKKIGSRNEAEEQLAVKISEPEVRQFLLKSLYRNKTGTYQWKMNLPAIFDQYGEILREVEAGSAYEGETLFVKGALSGYIDEEEFQEYKRIFPNARLQSIENAGHWVHADQPGKFVETVRRFLEQ